MPGKAKVAVKEAKNFAKKFWSSAVAKMPGKSKSEAEVDLPAMDSPQPPPSAPPVQNQTTPVNSSVQRQLNAMPQAPAPSASNQNNNNAPWQRSTTPPPAINTGDLYHDQTAVGARIATQRPPAPPPQVAPPQVAPSQPPPQPALQPAPATNADPVLEYQRLSKQVEDDVYKLARMLPEIKTQEMRDGLVKATNKAHQTQPNYAGAIQDLKQIQKDLNDQRGSLEDEAYDDRCQLFERKLRHEARQILGNKAVPLGTVYLSTRKDVIAGKVTRTRAIPVVEKLTRDLEAQTQKRMQAILAVAADYERLQPALTRAKAALAAADSSVPANLADQANVAFSKQEEIFSRVPAIRQFFPEGTDAHGPPLPPSPIGEIEKVIAEGFKDGLQSGDLEALRKSLAELEKLAFDVIKNMDVQGELSKQSATLPVDPSQLQLTTEELGKGKYAKTFVIEAQGVPPMAAKIPQDSATAQRELDKEAEVYARLGDHPNIVKCYGKQTLSNGKPALVMEKVEGEEITKVFNELALKYNKGEVDRAEYIGSLQHIIHGILSGLAQFEALGLAHRDIKSDNIRFDPVTGEAKILDMGLAEEHGTFDPQNTNKVVKWTPPEFFTQGLVGAKTDSFGAGQTAYQQFERNLGRDEKDPWKVQASEGETVGEGNLFVAGFGPGRSAEVGPDGVKEGAKKALDLQGNPTVMPLTKASDQKRGGEHPGRKAPGSDPGNYAVETAYVDFMNKLMHPDPAKRMSPSEALRHPFMTQRLLEPEQAGQIINTPRKQAQSAAPSAPNPPPPNQAAPNPPAQNQAAPNPPPPNQAAPNPPPQNQAAPQSQPPPQAPPQNAPPPPQTAPQNTGAQQPQTAATNSTQDNPHYN